MVRHAVFREGGGQFTAQVFLALDVEKGADVGDFVGEEGEGVLAALVYLDVGGALEALTVGAVVDAQGAGLAAIDYAPNDGQLACVGEVWRLLVAVGHIEGVRPRMRQLRLVAQVVAPPKGDKQLVEHGT